MTADAGYRAALVGLVVLLTACTGGGEVETAEKGLQVIELPYHALTVTPAVVEGRRCLIFQDDWSADFSASCDWSDR